MAVMSIGDATQPSLAEDSAALVREVAVRAEERIKGVLIGSVIGLAGGVALLYFFPAEIGALLAALGMKGRK